MSDLTPKQEAFCQKYIELGNASEAYRQSYDAENSQDKTIWEEASRLLADPKVSARVDELAELHLKRHEVTINSLTRELVEDRLFAYARGQASAAVAATLGKAKLHGKMIERLDATLRKPLNEMTDEELNAAIAEAQTRTGTSIPPDSSG